MKKKRNIKIISKRGFFLNEPSKGLPWFLVGIGGIIVIFGEQEFRYYLHGHKGGAHIKTVDIEDLGTKN